MPDPIRAAGLLFTADASPARAHALRRAAMRGDLRRLARGAFVGQARWDALGAADRHALRVRAALASARAPALVSHSSAAALHGLPLVGVRDERVHLTFRGASNGVSRGGVARHVVGRDVAEVTVGGIRVTSAARTVVDVARTWGFLPGVAAGDAALRRALATPDEMHDELEALGSGRGVRVARDVVAFVDSRSESPGESLSRVRMQELGLPVPALQHVVTDHRGFVGRVDFWWEEPGVVGEFDGRSKYGLDGSVPAAADRLWDEKLREDRLRATGVRVARWTWADAWAGAPMAAILHAAGIR